MDWDLHAGPASKLRWWATLERFSLLRNNRFIPSLQDGVARGARTPGFTRGYFHHLPTGEATSGQRAS
jgi:hypothetical protein